MKKETGIIINGNEFNSLLDVSKIKFGKKCSAYRYMRSACDVGCRVFITATDKKGTKWKFNLKRQTFEKFKTVGAVFKYVNKLRKQRLKRKANKIMLDERFDLVK